MGVSQGQAVLRLAAAVSGTMAFLTGLIACGYSPQSSSYDASATPTPTPTPTAVAAVKVTNAAGRYAEHIAKKPIPAIYKPYDPQLLFYALYVNCAGCHDFVTNLNQVKARLKKNKAYDSIQDKISTGSMPPNKPDFATSAEGKELLSLLNSL